jgi:hypothetical protein
MSVAEAGTSLLVNGLEVTRQDGDWNENITRYYHARATPSQSPVSDWNVQRGNIFFVQVHGNSKRACGMMGGK